MSVSIVVGAQWGDEGKGKLVDLLSEQVDVIARYQGGANAGHTIEFGKEKYVLHLIPSGIFHEHAHVVIGNGVVIDPAALIEEMDLLVSKGIDPSHRLHISSNAHLILPYHKLEDSLLERGPHAVGTTGRGIGPAYTDKVTRVGIRMGAMLDPETFATRMRASIREHNALILSRFGVEGVDEESVIQQYLGFAERIAPFITDTVHYLHQAHVQGMSILCEGAQGALLDIEHGTYPYVTSSHPTSGGAMIGLGLPPTSVDEVVGVMKAYCTRVGLGPFPTELNNDLGESLRKAGAEFGATTGRPRRCGWLDLVALSYASAINGLSRLGVTKLDVLRGMPEISVCTAYRIDGKELRWFPPDPIALKRVEPVYTTFSGWTEDIGDVRQVRDLPKAANDYLTFIRRFLDVRISHVSVGPRREQTITVKAGELD